ncbi:hypothetical protein [Lentilactobacillus parabuchneri]|uniref:hypothetical protein n=1 Tax=Lentilactobacillus parabuchneri TaxID=152331 RepID=UPI0026488B4B|nr:hypothetical protein [Lentilactobacillus parabuchneri]MDN6435606.1 hypothetical protein [Lentilactobacillus parabuchneri]
MFRIWLGWLRLPLEPDTAWSGGVIGSAYRSDLDFEPVVSKYKDVGKPTFPLRLAMPMTIPECS